MHYKQLTVWQCAMDLVDMVYDVTDTMLKHESFTLISQIRRSAISIPSNIAEGSARAGTKELLQFLAIARGSLAELETQLIIGQRRKYFSVERLEAIQSVANEVGIMSQKLTQTLRQKNTNHSPPTTNHS